MTDIKTDAITFNMYYGNKSESEVWADGDKPDSISKVPVTEETPIFRKIDIRNIVCNGAGRAMEFKGLPEMPIEDIFSITGRGTVVTGRIETGTIHVNDPAEIVGFNDKPRTTVVTGVEMFRKLLDQGEAGDNVGLLLRGIDKKEVKRGEVIAKPGSIKPHSHFLGQIYVLKKEEGGRHTPFHNKYRPQFFIRTLDVTGEISLPEGVEMVMPGDNVEINVQLITPVALNEGLRFAIREGGRTVGAGQVIKILD